MKKRVFFFSLACALPLIFGFVCYPLLKYIWGQNPRYHIQAIVQKKPAIDSLQCAYLAQILDVNSEKKVNLYHFDLKEGEKKLRSTIVIKEVLIKKLKPHTLFVEYTLRTPLAYVADFANTAIDEEGLLFPFAPFYTPKHLPEICFGENFSSEIWGRSIIEKKMRIVKQIMSSFPPHSVSWIDLSHMDASSLGKKEIVVECGLFLLRLSTKRYLKEIEYFFLLQEKYLKEEKMRCIIDLRLPNIAFLRKGVVM